MTHEQEDLRIARAVAVLQRTNLEALRLRRDDLVERSELRKLELRATFAKRRTFEPGSHSRANAAHWVREDVRELRHIHGKRVTRAMDGSLASL